MLLRIVYIDDEEELCLMFRQLFSRNGFEVIAFSDPRKGMEYITAQPPDIIFFDYRLPGANGDELALRLGDGTPKYLVTGELDVKTKYPFKKIFHKPYRPEDILAEIKKYLSKTA